MADNHFAWPVRVYYEDTDAAGIVYHANYLRFMERARTEWLRALGYGQDRVRREHGVVFVITESDVRYLAAARFDEELVVTTRLERLRRASMSFTQAIEAADGRAVCSARNSVACVDAESLAPRRIPADMLKDFERAQ
ncbi:MAG: tol-pal system-associated acyl-CoA thioesterase [Gammaproteobacteria bacterium]|nr:tol-pal system-associated acyl-CoA thioesterase [Gammaproteobacteria bacterium]MCP5200637.1 tol-pal system-associated acyl-CoA thioesterase [Gammaproteobacteria bacterium]